MHRKKAEECFLLDRVGTGFMGLGHDGGFYPRGGRLMLTPILSHHSQPPGLQAACAHELNVQVTENVHSWGVCLIRSARSPATDQVMLEPCPPPRSPVN